MGPKRIFLPALTLFAFIITVVTAGSAALNATSCMDLVAAIDSINAGGSITLTSGFTMTSAFCSSQLPLKISKTVTIQGQQPTSAGTILQGDNTAPAFWIWGASSPTVTFKYITFQNFKNPGVNSPTLVPSGGAFYVDNSANLCLDTCTVTQCNAAGGGGAVFLRAASNLTLISALLSDNKATNGGGIYAEQEVTINIVSSIFHSNMANVEGGAIYSLADSITATAGSSIFDSNVAGVYGGALTIGQGFNKFTGSPFTSNTAGVRGGALHVIGGESFFTQCTFTGNADSTNSSTSIGSADLFSENSPTVAFCPLPNQNSNPHTLYGPFEQACFGVNNTIQDCQSLASAIANAVPGSTLYVSNYIEIYPLACPGVTLPIVIGKNLIIRGADPNPSFNVLTGQLRQNNALFVVNNHSSVSFYGIVFREFVHDTANGPVVSVVQGSQLYVDTCTFANSKTWGGNGGAVYIGPNCNATFQAPSFRYNFAINGGALAADTGSTVYMYTATLEKNVAQGFGGAVWTSGDLRLDESSITANQAGLGGGGMEVYGGNVLLFAGGGFSQNTALYGGGLSIHNGGSYGVAQTRFTHFSGNGAVWTPGVGNINDLDVTSNDTWIEPGKGSIFYICPPGFNAAHTIHGNWSDECPSIAGTVDNCQKLVAAINGAQAGDVVVIGAPEGFNGGAEIHVSPANCGVSLPIVINKPLILRGAASSPIYNVIDGLGQYPLFLVAGANIDVNFEGITFRQPYTLGRGAAVFVDVNNGARFFNCYANNANASKGGAVYLATAARMFWFNGGVQGSVAQSGGAAYGEELSSMVLDNLAFTGNQATDDGGAISTAGTVNANIVGFGSNRAVNKAGAVELRKGAQGQFISASITSNVVSGSGAGGGLYVDTCSEALLYNTFLYNNHVQGNGTSAIYQSGSAFINSAAITTQGVVYDCSAPSLPHTDAPNNLIYPNTSLYYRTSCTAQSTLASVNFVPPGCSSSTKAATVDFLTIGVAYNTSGPQATAVPGATQPPFPTSPILGKLPASGAVVSVIYTFILSGQSVATFLANVQTDFLNALDFNLNLWPMFTPLITDFHNVAQTPSQNTKRRLLAASVNLSVNVTIPSVPVAIVPNLIYDAPQLLTIMNESPPSPTHAGTSEWTVLGVTASWAFPTNYSITALDFCSGATTPCSPGKCSNKLAVDGKVIGNKCRCPWPYGLVYINGDINQEACALRFTDPCTENWCGSGTCTPQTMTSYVCSCPMGYSREDYGRYRERCVPMCTWPAGMTPVPHLNGIL